MAHPGYDEHDLRREPMLAVVRSVVGVQEDKSLAHIAESETVKVPESMYSGVRWRIHACPAPVFWSPFGYNAPNGFLALEAK